MMIPDGDLRALADAIDLFLEDHDDGDRALEVDVASETWTFDDIDLDSRTFGELVSRGIVEKGDGEYRVADRAVLKAVVTDAEAATRKWGLDH